MRIAFDARPLTPQRTGIGRYLRGIIEGLLCCHEIEAFFLCSCRAVAVDEGFPSDPRVKFIVNRGWKGNLWLQCMLPIHLKYVRADLFHGSLYLLPLLCPCPSLVYVYDLSFHYFPTYLERKNRVILEALLPFSIRHSTRIATLSEFTRQEIIREWHVSPEKVVVIPGAPSPHFYGRLSQEADRAIMDRYGLKGPYILYVGTLEPRKNLARLIEAFSRIHTVGVTDHQLVLVGQPGWGLKQFYSVLERSPVKERIKILGFVPDTDLPAIYRGADVFVYLSIYEGFGFPPLEAMACGTPVVASNGSSIPECVGDGGILVDPLNVDEIAGQIVLLLKDKALRQEIGKRGLDQSLRFSWERSAAKTMELYQEICLTGTEE